MLRPLTETSDVEAVKETFDLRCCNRLSCFCLENALELQRNIGAQLRRIITSGNPGDELVEYVFKLEGK